LLRLEQLYPGRLKFKEQGDLYALRALLYRRRGQHLEALGYLAQTERLLQQGAVSGQLQFEDLAQAKLQLLADRSDCLEALNGTLDRAEVRQGLTPPMVGKSIDILAVCQGLADKGHEDRALKSLEMLSEELVTQSGYAYWRWRLCGVTVWGMVMITIYGSSLSSG
jgi:hypothetical protein